MEKKLLKVSTISGLEVFYLVYVTFPMFLKKEHFFTSQLWLRLLLKFPIFYANIIMQ